MRKVIYCVGIALLTFSLGAVVYYVTRPKTSQPVPLVQARPVEVREEYRAEIEVPVEAPAPGDFSVVIKTDLGEGEEGSHTVRLAKNPVVVEDHDVPEYVDGQDISIVGGDNASKFRIFERYRTSMTVMGEGPHLDLVDWRHFDSEWIAWTNSTSVRFEHLRATGWTPASFRLLPKPN